MELERQADEVKEDLKSLFVQFLWEVQGSMMVYQENLLS